MAALLQFEVNLARFLGVARRDYSAAYAGDDDLLDRIRFLARTAINDTIRNGGTFVLVCDGKTVTMVQQDNAAEIEPVSPTKSEGET